MENGDWRTGELQLLPGGVGPTTIVADLQPFSPMENGEACPGCGTRLQGALGALLYTHVYCQCAMENGEWSSKIGRVPSLRGAEAR